MWHKHSLKSWQYEQMKNFRNYAIFGEKLCDFFANSIRFLFQNFLDFFSCKIFEFSIDGKIRFNHSVNSNWCDQKLTSLQQKICYVCSRNTNLFYDPNPMYATVSVDVNANTFCGLCFLFLMNDSGFMTKNGNNWPDMGYFAAYLSWLLNANITLKHITWSIIGYSISRLFFHPYLYTTLVWPMRTFYLVQVIFENCRTMINLFQMLIH